MPAPSVLKSEGELVGSDFKADARWEKYRYQGKRFRLQPEAGWVHRIGDE